MEGTKKLVLNRETLRELSGPDLGYVVAGAGAGAGAAPPPLPPPTGCENTGIICEYSQRTCCFTG